MLNTLSVISGATRSGLMSKCLNTPGYNQVKCYSNKSKNILRSRYWARNKDGTNKEYNESITLIPEEFKDQGKKSNHYVSY